LEACFISIFGVRFYRDGERSGLANTEADAPGRLGMERYNRELLYQQVWERPMLKVAEEYGVSSVALGKICKKLGVPVPGRGHWAKLAHGHAGARKLPLIKLENVPVIYRSRQSEQVRKAAAELKTPAYSGVGELLASGALKPPSIDHAAKPHPLIRLTTSLLRSQSRKDEHGILLPREAGGLDVRVTAGMLDRALQVMAQVVAVLEAQGLSVEIDQNGATVSLIHGQQISFGIEERVHKIVTKKARVPNPTDRWDYDESTSYETSGRLELLIHTSTWRSDSLRCKWSDAKRQRVENLVPDFVAGLMRMAIAIQRAYEERKRLQEEQEARDLERATLRKMIEEEEAKVAELTQCMEGWEEAERIRRFTAAYTYWAASRPAEEQPRRLAWIEWARCQAARLDPFVRDKPKSVLDRKNELRG
jgi:hypothetical protein